jgi:hypothetical protein
MSKQKKNSKYATVGSLIFQSQFDEEGNRIEGEYKTDDKGRKLYVLKLDKNTKITINGVDMTGKTLYVSRPETKLTRLLDRGVIDQEEFEKKVADFSPGGRLEFVQMEITADLDK